MRALTRYRHQAKARSTWASPALAARLTGIPLTRLEEFLLVGSVRSELIQSDRYVLLEDIDLAMARRDHE